MREQPPQIPSDTIPFAPSIPLSTQIVDAVVRNHGLSIWAAGGEAPLRPTNDASRTTRAIKCTRHHIYLGHYLLRRLIAFSSLPLKGNMQ